MELAERKFLHPYLNPIDKYRKSYFFLFYFYFLFLND